MIGSVLDYFRENEVMAHTLRLISVGDKIATVALKPEGLDVPERIFCIPDLAQIECPLMDAGICKGGSR